MRTIKKRRLALLLALAAVWGLTACDGDSQDNEPENEQSQTNSSGQGDGLTMDESGGAALISQGMMPLDYAENFSVELYKGGYRMIRGGGNNVQMLVVPESADVPAELDEDVIVLQQPIDRVYAASTGMVSLIDAIDALDHIRLVSTDVGSWYIDGVVEKMTAGDIAYSGNYKEPDYELMAAGDIQLHIDTSMVEDYPAVIEKFDALGIPTFIESAALESHPLGRVEWVKLLGVLFNREDEALQYFEAQKALMDAASSESTGKSVAAGYIASSGKCYARNGGDYMVQMIGIAGGDYILFDMNPDQSGSSSVTFEDWYVSFKDADYLIYVSNFAVEFGSTDAMIEYSPLFADFRAVQEGHVYVTSPDFFQSTAAIASIVSDINTILTSGDPEVTTDHLIRLR